MSAIWTPAHERSRRMARPLAQVDAPVAAEPQVAERPVATVTPARLGRAALGKLPATVKAPLYDVDALRPGILHLGCGAFHRAHQALLTQRAIEEEVPATKSSAVPPPWGIVATGLRSPGTVRALDQQDGLYTVLERRPERTRVEVVGTLRKTLFAPDSGAALDRVFADPEIRIVTLTVTPSGYCVDAATGRLESGSTAIQDDLRNERPSSAIGLLTRGLATRRDSGGAPPVVLSCDNLPSNGRVLQQACIDYASLQNDGLARWIGSEVQFPATMVDRIVPATTDEDRDFATRSLGMKDMVPVSAEPFSQWVIERFEGPRPRWDAVGAEYVTDVAPWEASKLRLLNGGHLAVAYLGLLAGYSTVAGAMAQPVVADYALQFMVDEQKPTLPSSDHDIDAYARQLLQRWRNGGIVHPLQRVGRDGSMKVQGRLLASLQENLAAGRPAPCTVLAVAAWLLCMTQDDATGRPLIEDERADAFRSLRRTFGNEVRPWVEAAVAVRSVFGDVLPRDAMFVAALVAALVDLQRRGPLGAMRGCRDAAGS